MGLSILEYEPMKKSFVKAHPVVLGALAFLLFYSPPLQASDPLVVVAGPNSLLIQRVKGKALTVGEVREIFMGKTRFVGTQRLKPINAKNPEVFNTFVQTVCGMKGSTYDAYWVRKTFSEGISPPIISESTDGFFPLLQDSGALAYMPQSEAKNSSTLVILLVLP